MPHAWYSTKQEQLIQRDSLRKKPRPGCVKWQHKDGHSVYATVIAETMDHGCNTDTLDDLTYLGEVVKFFA